MTSPALSTFLPIVIIVIALIVWWRTTIVIVGAFLISVLVVGLHEVVDRIDQPSARETVVGPPVGGDLPVPGPLGRTGTP